MTVKALCEKLELTCIAGQAGLDGEVTGCYICDLLSWVMGRAPEGSAWITVMGNINSIAVAMLTGVACVILCEGSGLDKDASSRADENGIPVLSGGLPAYDIAKKIAALL